MKNDPASLFNFKGNVEFHDLNYFDVDPNFVFKSKLYEYNPKDTITVYGTKGESRIIVRDGYVVINDEANQYKINVYESKNITREKYHTI